MEEGTRGEAVWGVEEGGDAVAALGGVAAGAVSGTGRLSMRLQKADPSRRSG